MIAAPGYPFNNGIQGDGDGDGCVPCNHRRRLVAFAFGNPITCG